ncbi:MAG: DUF4445 domain-containing protein [Lachnospiraceae bacterium]|nr:DUF4445 domain-containing protein [Lachnospiraceae bacterium]MBR0434450.1 DUF4445 domain-containing protein [Lachnospiraceae bacterium]
MPLIHDLTTGKKFAAERGVTLLKALLAEDIYVDNACNGMGTCGKCKVYIEGIGEVLSCEYKVNSDITIKTDKKRDNDMNILSKVYVPDFTKEYRKGYGIICDIGTTTVAVGLVDLATGGIPVDAAAMNAQRVFGQDVLTRITYEIENGDEGIKALQNTVMDCIRECVKKCCTDAGIDEEEVVEYVIAANCTMTHMALGVDARSIGVAPYKPVFTEGQERKARSLGLPGAQEASVYFIPQVSGYIGGDIVAGAYCCEMADKKGISLFIDIGTNGEIVLSNKGSMVSCSCAAGPALEGMNIECGMPALTGAIEEVCADEGDIKTKAIGNTDAVGICGSGILDTLSVLIKEEIIKKTGAFKKPEECGLYEKHVIKDDSGVRLMLTDKVYMSQKDVRQVQLAKGAILSGIRALLNREGVKPADIDEVLIAGQFGAHLREEALIVTGIIPAECEGKIRYVGNTSKTGAYMALMSEVVRSNMELLAKKISYFELAEVENYEMLLVSSMSFKD